MVRILTYNVHRCVGVDRRLDVGRVAAVIAAQEPDIVALQELDVGRARTGGADQAHRLAQRLGGWPSTSTPRSASRKNNTAMRSSPPCPNA